MNKSEQNEEHLQPESEPLNDLTVKEKQVKKEEANDFNYYLHISIGFLFAFASEFCLAFSNVLYKKCELFNVIEQAFVRYCLQFISMLIIIRLYKLSMIQTDRKINLELIARSILGTMSILLTMVSLKLINPSDTIALVNLNVVFVAILARFFLPNEKLTIYHILCIPVIFTGIILLCKPTFLFRLFESNGIKDQNMTNQTSDGNKTEKEATHVVLGVVCGLGSALCWSLAIILVRRLNLARVHFSISVIYTSFCALPVTVVLGLLLFLFNLDEKLNLWNLALEKEVGYLIGQVVYMLVGAVCGVLQIVFFNLALKYMQTAQIALVQPVDLVFGFLLQNLLLNIGFDLFGIIGSSMIMVGVFSVIIINYLKYQSKKRNNV